MPFVSSNAFAACKRIVFAYAPIASDTTNVVEIVRYYNDSANTWFVDAGCSGTGTRTVEIPLRGVFDRIPVTFDPTGDAYAVLQGFFQLGQTPSGIIECNRDVPDVLTCGVGRGSNTTQIVEGYFSARHYFNNVYPSGTSSCKITTFSYKTGSLKYNCLAAGDCVSFDVYGTDKATPLKTFYYDSNAGLYYADSVCSQFLGSFDVSANLRLSQNAALPIAFNPGSYVSPTVYDVVYTGSTQVAESRGAGIYCNYDQATDYVNYMATTTCQFDYDVSFRGAFWVNAVLRPAIISSPGTVSVYREDGYSYVKATYPCLKASIYGIEQRAANIAVSTSPVLYLYNKNGAWYSDSSCSTPLGDDNSFNIQINKTLGVPYLYGTDASAGLRGHFVGESYAAITGLPFMCNYRDGQTVVTCNWLVDKLLADTSYYPTDYAVLSSSIREIMSRRETDGSVLVILSPNVSGACYTLSVNLGSGVVINMYYDSGNKVWRARSCTGEDITADGVDIAVSGTRNNIPVSFSTTSSDDVPQATIGNSYSNITNVYVLYDAHKDPSSFTLKPTGAITANTTLYTAYDFPSSNAKSLVVTYSNLKQHLKNYYQIKIMENDSMPETIFYHDGSGYYDSDYNSIPTSRFSVSLNASVTKVPVIFQYTEVESPVTKSVSNWGGVPSVLFCDYDLVKSQRTMNCKLPSLNDTENRAYYVYSYAALDARKLKVVGGAYPLTAYCNPLVLASGYTERKTYYSQYYQDASTSEYRIRWYSDDTCTTELTQNLVNGVNYPFRLPLVQYDGVYAVPFLFNTTGSSAATIEADSSISNSGPIYCVYNSAENSADCMFNWVDGDGPGGILGAPVSTAIYFGGRSAKVLDDKTLLISNTFSSSSNTTVIEYFIPEFCSRVALSVIGGTEKIYYTNGAEWFGDASCTNPQGLVLPDAPEGQVILYFKQKCSLLPNVIDVSDDSITYTVSADVPCIYSSDTDVTSCSFNLSEITTDRAYCANDFAMKCNPQPSAGCELDVTLNGIGSIRVDYTNCCLAGYHDENGVSSTLPVGQTSCK